MPQEKREVLKDMHQQGGGTITGASQFFLALGVILAGLSVILGAFGAHALAPILGSKVGVWNTAVQYQMFHSLALVAIGLLLTLFSARKLFIWAGIFLLIGTLLFSGSLYAIGLMTVPNVGLITPLGGLFFIGGWLLLLTAVMASKSRSIHL